MTNASTASSREPFDTQAWVRAAGEGDAAQIKSLLAAGADVNAALENGETALIRATSKGHLHNVRTLLEAGADPNVEREDGFNALWIAVLFGHVEIVRALLSGGATPAAQGRFGTSVEQWARFNGFTEIVEMLRAHGSALTKDSVEGALTTSERNLDTPMFFPVEGEFSPVVPLSNIDESPAMSEKFPAIGEPDIGVERSMVRSTDDDNAPEEQDVATIVPVRVGPAYLRSRTQAGRPKGIWQTGPVVAIALALSVIAGLFAGTYLIASRRSVDTRQPATFAATTAPSTEAAPQVRESQPASSTSSASSFEPAQAAPQHSESRLSNEPVESAASAARVAASVVTQARREGVNVEQSASKPASQETVSTSRRAPHDETLSQDALTASAALERPARTGRRSGPNASSAANPVSRDGAATQRASSVRILPSISAPSKRSLPVSSQSPSADSKRVIHWP